LVLEGLELRLIPSVDTSGPLGTWYLNDNSFRITAMIRSGPQPNTYLGSLINENGGTETLDQISWNAATRLLEFRRNGPGFWQWYHGSIVEGVYVGRFSQSTSSASRPALTGSNYAFHVTGWDSDYLDQDIAPRAYDVIMNTNYRTELRIDRSPTNPSQFIGRFKVYATVNGGANGEEPEYDLDVTHWDGRNLSFVRHDPNWKQTFTGVATGRTISGTFTQTGSSTTYVWSGTRSNVLTYGLDPKSDAGRADWQDRTRRALEHLMMADDPAPMTTQVTVLQSNLAPFPSTQLPPNRDDNPVAWPRNYRVSELQFDYTLPNPYGGAPMTRRAHGYLAEPTPPPPAGCQRPAVVAVNGHGGSAWKMMNPDDSLYWYGDAYARRGYIVLALDISTRPVADRRGLYDNDPNGLDLAHGNGPHPSIKAPGFDADFEEEGERVWDAMRGLDYLRARSDVNPNQVLTTGLSLGGEVATIFGALEPRLAMSIPTGFSPDLNVMYYHGNDRDWLWNNADVREYVDTSDYYALTAPRPLIVETGKVDFTFSSHNPPFAADKQVARRTRVTYNGGPFLHYLHYDEHHYHVGDINPTRATEQGVRVPTVIEPQPPGTLGWQSDSTTAVNRRNLFEAIGALLPPASCATHFQIRLQPPVAPVVAGSPVRLVVTALDNNGLPDAAYRGTVHFQSTDAAATLPADSTFTAADHGSHTISVTLRTAGSRTVTATAGGRPPIVGSVTLLVHPAVASHFEVRVPATTTAGAPFSMTITARDPFNNVATGYRGIVAFSSSDGQATLPSNYGFTAADSGMHTFSATLRTAGTQSLTATDTVTASITGTQAGILVTAAAADHFDIAAPDSSVAGQSFDVTVTARDPYGNVDVHYLGTVTFTSADAAASLPADYAFTAGDSGVHTFSGGATLVTAGDQDVTATGTTSGITGAAIVTVTPAAVDHFQVSAPPDAPSGTAFDVTVMAVDAYGNLVPDYTGTVTFTCTDQDPNVLLPSDYTFTPADGGMQTFSGGVTLITVGDQTLTVQDSANQLQGTTVVTVDPAGTAPGAQQKPADQRARSLAEIIAALAADRSVRPEDWAQEQERRDRFFATVPPAAVRERSDPGVDRSMNFAEAEAPA
jgi:dienelactone hydrolase